MKYTKVFAGNKRLKDIYVGASKWQVFKYRISRFMRKIAIVAFLVGFAYLSGKIGANLFPVTVYAEKQVEVIVELPAPVMERIAKCESGATHYRDGQVIYNANKNGSVDIGYFQINSIHSKKATEMGLDLTKQDDNVAYAMYLYKNLGTEPWYSSKSCWNK